MNAISQRKLKKEKAEEIFLGKIILDLKKVWDDEFRVFLYNMKVDNPYKVMGELLKELHRLAKEIKAATNIAIKLDEPEIVRLLNLSYQRLEEAYGLCFDTIRGKTRKSMTYTESYRHNVREANALVEEAVDLLSQAVQFQERRIKRAS